MVFNQPTNQSVTIHARETALSACVGASVQRMHLSLPTSTHESHLAKRQHMETQQAFNLLSRQLILLVHLPMSRQLESRGSLRESRQKGQHQEFQHLSLVLHLEIQQHQ